MKTHKILILPNNVEIEVLDGKKLLDSIINSGLYINASCGGNGICAKCRVVIEEGKVRGGITERLSKDDIKSNFRLACKSYVIENIKVTIPLESKLSSTMFNFISKDSARIKNIQLNEEDYLMPVVEKFFLNLSKPNNDDQLSDVFRIISYFKTKLFEKNFQVNLPVIRKIPEIIRKSDYSVTVTVARPVRSNSKNEIINIQSGKLNKYNYGIAVDIGTTTIYAQIINLINGEVLAEYGDYNKQISYGEDIISRIIFSETKEGLNILNRVLVKSINSVINQIVKLSKIKVDNISTIVFAGNTTMTQLFLKISPKFIRISPYVPTSNIYPPIPAINLGISLNDHITALIYPVVSSYVGGDIVSGVMGSGMYMKEKLTLFIDLGTNAEIVLGNKDWLLCAACSAGPAFEGGGIEFGMRATLGAIEDFYININNFEHKIETIGSISPVGICGSGLINIIAVFFENGIINNSGKFNFDLNISRIRKINGIYEYILSWKHENKINRDIVITELDIENFIRAKGAIFSGCFSLLSQVNMGVEDISEIILAGGFGSHVNLEKAMTVGLLPEIDLEKITFVGNSSLIGARMCSLTNRIRKDVSEVVAKMTNCELSNIPSYMDNYIASLFIPHTDLNMFPKLKKRLLNKRIKIKN